MTGFSLKRIDPLDRAALSLFSLAIVFLFSGCKTTPPAKPTSQQTQPIRAGHSDIYTGIEFPAQLMGMPYAGMTDFESRSPGLGKSITYQSDKERLEFFIYSQAYPIIPSGINSDIVVDAFNQALDDIHRVAREKRFSEVKTTSKGNSVIGNYLFFSSALNYHDQANIKQNWLFVTGFNTKILKIRYTRPLRKSSTTRQRMDAFRNAVAKLLSDAEERGHGGMVLEEIITVQDGIVEVNLEDGLSVAEAILIAQVEMLNIPGSSAWDLTKPRVIGKSVANEIGVKFPARKMRQPVATSRKPITIWVNSEGFARIEK